MIQAIFRKAYGIFSILFCAAISLIAVLTVAIPVYDYGFTPLNNEGQFLFRVLLVIFALLPATAQPVALAGFYFSGGIGRKWYSHLLFGLLAISFAVLVLLIVYAFYYYFSGNADDYYNKWGYPNLDRQLGIPALLIGSLHQTFFPIAFTAAALVAKKVDVWKRFLPVISIVLSLIIAGGLALLIVGIGTVTGSETIYHGYKEATMPQWFMLGAIGWGIIGIVGLFPNKTQGP